MCCAASAPPRSSAPAGNIVDGDWADFDAASPPDVIA